MKQNVELEVFRNKPQVYFVKVNLTQRVHNYARNTEEWISTTDERLFANADAALEWFYSRLKIVQKERAVKSNFYSNINERADGDLSNRLYALFYYIVNRYKRYVIDLDTKPLCDNEPTCDSLFYGKDICALSRIDFDNDYSSENGDYENQENAEGQEFINGDFIEQL